jgi:hypothetical protein
VRKGDAEVTLTAKEFDLLLLFIRNPDRAFTREEICSRIWGDDLYVDPSNIAVHVRRLREKIENDPSQPRHIETVWGVGYRWKPQDRRAWRNGDDHADGRIGDLRAVRRRTIILPSKMQPRRSSLVAPLPGPRAISDSSWCSKAWCALAWTAGTG